MIKGHMIKGQVSNHPPAIPEYDKGTGQ